MLLDNAREKGVEVREETKATSILREKGRVVGVKAVGKDGREYEVAARMTIDASGRDIFTLQQKQRPHVGPRAQQDGRLDLLSRRDCATRASMKALPPWRIVPERGWFWYIPLPDDMVSVGVVAEKDYLFTRAKGAFRDLPRRGGKERSGSSSTSPTGSRSAGTIPRASIPTAASTAPRTAWCS